MHIAFLTPEYPSTKTGNSGGLGTSIKNLANALLSEGMQVSVFIYGQQEDEQYHENGIHFYRIKNIFMKGLSWWLTRKKVEHCINLANRKHNIDIIEVADWTGFSSFISFPCKIVMRLNGSDTYFCYLEKRPVKKWNKFLEKRAFSEANAIIAVSYFVGKTTNQIFNTNKKYTVIPNSIDATVFKPNQVKCHEPLVLYFGTLIRKKGVLNIPQIFNSVIKQMPNAHLVLVGGDTTDINSGNSSTWNMMKTLFTDEAFKQTTYLGQKPYEEIQQYIQKATVCIFPSYAEALPVSWLEAMAMGKGIVASNIGWAAEMIENKKEGLLYNPTSHEAFSNAILLLLSDEILCAEMGKNARLKVLTTFDNNIIAKRNIAFYKNLINETQ